MANFFRFYVLIYRQTFHGAFHGALMIAFRSSIALILSISLSILVLTISGRPQNPPPKSTQPQTPGVQGTSGEKKALNDQKSTAEDETGAAERNKISELQQRGVELALQVGEMAKEIDDRRNSAIILAVAADLLFPYREELARELFQRAFDTAVAYYQETPDDNRGQPGKHVGNSRKDVRVEVIKLINKRDPKMGVDYNEKYVEAKKKEDPERAAREFGSNHNADRFFGNVSATNGLIDAANNLLNEDARLAVDIARRAVDLSISPTMSGFLSSLAGRDRTAADGLYLHALERLRSNPAPLPGQLLALSAYPFGEGEIKISDGSNNSSWGFGKPTNFVVNPQLIQNYLTVSLGTLLRLADPAVTQLPEGASLISYALYAAKRLEPKVVEFHPALHEQWLTVTSRLAALNAAERVMKINREVERETEQRAARQRDEQRAKTSPGRQTNAESELERVKTLLDQAQQTTNFAQRDQQYGQAALSAARAGDIARALEISTRVSDMTYRGKLKSWINFDAAQAASGEKRYEDARKYALDVDEIDQRTYLLFEIARRALGDNNRTRALELLEEAARRAGDGDDTPEKVKALLGIANLYLKVDQVYSFNLAETAVRAANRIPSDKMTLGEDDGTLSRTISYGGGTSTNRTNVDGFDTRIVFRALAAHDFDRTLALAQSFENKSIRCRSMIAVAESAFMKK